MPRMEIPVSSATAGLAREVHPPLLSSLHSPRIDDFRAIRWESRDREDQRSILQLKVIVRNAEELILDC